MTEISKNNQLKNGRLNRLPDSEVYGLTIRGKLRGFVYQGVDPLFANDATLWDKRRQRRTNPEQFDPQTPKQLEQRSKIGTATKLWQELPKEKKEEYNRARVGRGYTNRYGRRNNYYSGFHMFISETVRNQTKK